MESVTMFPAPPPLGSRVRIYDDEFSVTNGAGATDEAIVERTMPSGPDVLAVEVVAVSQDGGLIAHGAAIDTVQLKLEPFSTPEGFGGALYHTFALLDTARRSTLDFRQPDGRGVLLKPGETVRVTVRPNAASKTIRVRFRRIVHYR